MVKQSQPIFQKIDLIFLAAFFVSFLNSILVSLFYIALVYYWKFGVEGCVKAMLLLTTRGIISSAMAASGGNTIKLLVLLATSAVIIFNAKPKAEDNAKVWNMILSTLLFVGIVSVSTLLFSSYPVTALSKLISFALPFCAVIMGVAATKDSCRWSEYFTVLFLILFAVSFLLIPFDNFRVVNDDFQGVFNHVNILGITLALFVAVLLNTDLLKRRPVVQLCILAAVFVMLYLSKSRTGMFSAIAVVAVHYLTGKAPLRWKVTGITFVLLLTVILGLVLSSEILGQIKAEAEEFVYKGHDSSIWYSRQRLIEACKQKFYANPVFGSGFMVPYDDSIVDYSLNLNLVIEPGNLLWALLGDTGIVGTALFAVLFLVCLLHGRLSRISLLLGAFAVNFGEMVFFSANNMSVLIYFLIALYIFSPEDTEKRKNHENSILHTDIVSRRL